MNNVIIILTATTLIMGFAIELAQIANQVSNKAIDFSEDMNKAMDCAITGRPLEECSPNLKSDDSYNFKGDATAFVAKVQDFQDQLNQETPGNETAQP
jgi:hypothetical protein